MRYRSVGGKTSGERADIEELDALSTSVYYAGGDSPTGNAPEMSWWAKKRTS